MKAFLPEISARHRLAAHAAIGIAALALACASANGATVGAVEYYHTGYQHYFVTADPVEIAALDGGLVPDLYRTGFRYFVDDAPDGGRKPICRFFTAAFGLPALPHRLEVRMCTQLMIDGAFRPARVAHRATHSSSTPGGQP